MIFVKWPFQEGCNKFIPNEGELMPAPCLADPDVVVRNKLHGALVPVYTWCRETYINMYTF